MEQLNTNNKNRSNEHTNHPNDTKTESYDSMMENIDYFSVFGFLLSRMAYELIHEKRVFE